MRYTGRGVIHGAIENNRSCKNKQKCGIKFFRGSAAFKKIDFENLSDTNEK